MPKILIIEDETSIAETILFVLQQDGFDTIWRTLGTESLTVLEQESIALVILDVGLPDMSGFEVCKSIRQFSDVPVLFLTARSDEIDRVVGLEIGADDYVTKPFSPRELVARVKVILKRVSGARTEAFPVEDEWQLDLSRREIRFHGLLLDLTRYEFGILSTLLESPGQVFSRSQLMQAAWQSPDHSLERAVDTHIKTLRAKLREISRQTDPIRTHRGVGYSLIKNKL